MIYDITHCTRFQYESASALGYNVLRMVPRETLTQHVLEASVLITPEPDAHEIGVDYFGNRTDYCSLHKQHEALTVEAKAKVDVAVNEAPSLALLTSAWDQPTAYEVDVLEFCYDSPHIERTPWLRQYAVSDFTPGRPLLEAALALTTRIYNEFSYVPGATDVSTAVAEVFHSRAGVCQDFAHLQIACLRSLGLPARYVSGYLATTPPPGQERLIGVDATHAWLAVYCPDYGWVDLDPTNNIIPCGGHVTVAWGRDYSDVAPITGVFTGHSNSAMQVAVTVEPAA